MLIDFYEKENLEKNNLIKKSNNKNVLFNFNSSTKYFIFSFFVLILSLVLITSIFVLNNTSYDTYTNFDIKLKEPIHKLAHHKNTIISAIILKDGRIVTCSLDHSIIIYNNKIFQPDIIIEEHNDWVRSVIQLSSGVLASCSDDKTIKLFNFSKNKYNILQTLNYHTHYIYN